MIASKPLKGGIDQTVLGPDGNLWSSTTDSFRARWVSRTTPEGTTTRVRIPTVMGSDLVSGPGGSVWGASSYGLTQIPRRGPARLIRTSRGLTGVGVIAARSRRSLWAVSYVIVRRPSATSGLVTNPRLLIARL